MNIPPATFALAFVAGWTLMTVAMMLPTSTPLVLLFYRMVAERSNAGWLVTLLVGGYLAAWALFGVACIWRVDYCRRGRAVMSGSGAPVGAGLGDFSAGGRVPIHAVEVRMSR
jgi:predicted metal-binding membrane protein